MPVEQITPQAEELRANAIEWHISEQIKKQMIPPTSRERAVAEIKDALDNRPEQVDRIIADYQHLEHGKRDKEAKAIKWYIEREIIKHRVTPENIDIFTATINDNLGDIGSKAREVRVRQILTDYDNAHGEKGKH